MGSTSKSKRAHRAKASSLEDLAAGVADLATETTGRSRMGKVSQRPKAKVVDEPEEQEEPMSPLVQEKEKVMTATLAKERHLPVRQDSYSLWEKRKDRSEQTREMKFRSRNPPKTRNPSLKCNRAVPGRRKRHGGDRTFLPSRGGG